MLQTLKENPRFLQDKIKHYFNENTHRLTLSMSPDEVYLEKQAKAEEEKLQKKIHALSDSDKKDIYEKGLELLAAQSKTQDASCLPALKVSDIEPTIPVTPVQISTAVGVPVQYCEQPTNGLVYFRAMCSLNTLPEDLRLYVPLFCSVVTKMGCGGLDYRQQSQQMELRTGGMSVSTQVVPDSTQLDMYEQCVVDLVFLSFTSLRDPNSVQTLSAFRRGVDWAKSGQFTQQDIDEAKLSVFSAVDSPVALADKGMGRFLSGVTDEMKQNHRERLFAVTHQSLVEVAERYLGVGQRTCGVAILGPENEAIKKDSSWIVK
ncbi:presequence protease, mitochondrial-like [Labrus mixtus]|uniref:presequence protease, mitochondrial-like n=1 Tax=Labrus mixtus TaxID=508554 RepID=UPI0029C09129|nr:presequence protease, mitochondrial-like [Labrus mixtus]